MSGDQVPGSWAGVPLGGVGAWGAMASTVVGWEEGSWGLGGDLHSQSSCSLPSLCHHLARCWRPVPALCPSLELRGVNGPLLATRWLLQCGRCYVDEYLVAEMKRLTRDLGHLELECPELKLSQW